MNNLKLPEDQVVAASVLADTANGIRRDLIDTVLGHDRGKPRSTQLEVGPSQLGIECDRSLAYYAHRQVGTLDAYLPGAARGAAIAGGDTWRPIVGTAIHAHLADVLSGDSGGRWLCEVETSAVVRSEAGVAQVGGTADVFDRETGTVIDHKTMSRSALDRLISHGPSTAYRVQLQVYALGLRQAGFDVRQVAIMGWLRDGLANDSHIWAAPYSEEEATHHMLRFARLLRSAEVDRGGVPAFGDYEASPHHSVCGFCPVRDYCVDAK